MKKLRIAVVGVGGRSSLWLIPELAKRDDCELVAICDHLQPKADWVIADNRLTNTKSFASVESMLASIDLDAIMITTGDAHHAEVAIPALQAGKYVFCEKPLDTTKEKCEAIINADHDAGGKTFVGFNLRYAPVYEKVKELIDNGELGQLLTIQADEFYNAGRTYFRRWNRLRSEGGGLWITKASHDFDLLQWLAGVKPLYVYATAFKSYYQSKPEAAQQCRFCDLNESCHDVCEQHIHEVTRQHEKCGGTPYDLCLYNADSDTFDHGIATVTFEHDIIATYTCNVVSGFTNRRIRVAGTKGCVDGDLNSGSLTLHRRDPSETVEIPLNCQGGGHGGADRNIISNFISFVNGQSEPKCRPKDALTPILMGLAATESSDTKQVVHMG